VCSSDLAIRLFVHEYSLDLSGVKRSEFTAFHHLVLFKEVARYG